MESISILLALARGKRRSQPWPDSIPITRQFIRHRCNPISTFTGSNNTIKIHVFNLHNRVMKSGSITMLPMKSAFLPLTISLYSTYSNRVLEIRVFYVRNCVKKNGKIVKVVLLRFSQSNQHSWIYLFTVSAKRLIPFHFYLFCYVINICILHPRLCHEKWSVRV